MSDENVFQILVVDDNEMNRDMLSRRMERQGYAVTTAENGEIALNCLHAQLFDLILLDVMMPILNGYEVLERVKNDAVWRDIPVIMISAVDDLDSVVRCIELGAEDYLFKPFNPVLLKARISASLERRAMRQRASQHGLETPDRQLLTSIQRRLAALHAGENGPLSDEQRTQLNTIIDDVDSLLA